jgi:hypothetical protein
MSMRAGECVQVFAPEPPAGMIFSHWSGDAEGTDDPLTVCLDRDKTIVANYEAVSQPRPPRFCGLGIFGLTPAMMGLMGLLKRSYGRRRDPFFRPRSRMAYRPASEN